MTNLQIKSCLLLVFILCFKSIFGQQSPKNEYQVLSSNLGMAGSSNTVLTDKGVYKVSQSVGQSSIIGTTSHNGYYLRQGYQQPQAAISIESTYNDKLNASIFPNPFKEILTISFSQKMMQSISVSIFDVNGKQVFVKDYQPILLLKLNLEHISEGTYFLNMTSGTSFFSAKLIKNK